MDCDVELVNKKFSNILALFYTDLLIICCLATLLFISSRVISLPIKRFRDILVAYVCPYRRTTLHNFVGIQEIDRGGVQVKMRGSANLLGAWNELLNGTHLSS